MHVPCDVAGIRGHRRFESGSFRVVAMAAALESPDPIYVVGIFVTALSGLLEVTPSFS